ncbi:uronate isomerase [Nonlabens tegetincola]|uniref:Uronate isomerase n=1 Tax=Nonlabens tegetincola TaxID=323273 RepID=A0A090Q4Q3_9FLAO|nr:glucuronate isomerase [Nonlabens tegetincola]GAK98054.1 uronate isomerase [Nonlabens tegetincola]
MSFFIGDDFLLETDFAKTLYHNHAKNLPIIDYHNHLSPQEIATDRTFENISQVWLAGDHYKWRAMRAYGINEKYITGDATDKEKFLKWAEVVPYTVRNPLYHWTHLELKNYFGINELLSTKTAVGIWDETSEILKQSSHSANGLLKLMNVESLCTTDDPTDDLEYHKAISNNSSRVKTLPTFRPDKAFAIENGQEYLDYIDRLSQVSGVQISTFSDLIEALQNRVNFFHENGCRLSDHGLEQLYVVQDEFDVNSAFAKALQKQPLSLNEIQSFKTIIMCELGKMYHQNGWTQQLHLGPIRNNNKRLLKELGSDTGFDSIGDFPQAVGLSSFLNELDATDQLAKTIIYNLNPSDNEVFATMAGNFNDGSIRGKVQYGSAWWFLDQKDGMEKQLNTLSNQGLLSCFVGMLTDSRSFLSFPRHEYFRRILCNLIGNDIANGELPNDPEHLGKIVSDICYHNAKNYFNF